MEETGYHALVEGATFRYRTQSGPAVIERLSFVIAAQEHVGVIGPSGCGKSTLVRLLCGLGLPQQGQVLLFGRPPEEAYQTGAIGLSLQDQSLVPWLSARRNVELPGRSGDTALTAKALDLLTQFGLFDKRAVHPPELSGGMKARVALARALVNDPKLVILDEPFSALDELTAIDICKKLTSICLRMSVFLVSHNLDAVARIAHRCLCMNPSGASPIVEVDLGPYGRPEERTEEQVREARSALLARYVR